MVFEHTSFLAPTCLLYFSFYVMWKISMTCSYSSSIRIENQKIMNPYKCFFIKVAALSISPQPFKHCIFLHNWSLILTDVLFRLLFRKTLTMPHCSTWFLHIFMCEQLIHYVPSSSVNLIWSLTLLGQQVVCFASEDLFCRKFHFHETGTFIHSAVSDPYSYHQKGTHFNSIGFWGRVYYYVAFPFLV